MIAIKRAALLGVVAAASLSTGCSRFLLKKGAESAAPYFDAKGHSGTAFEKIAPRVYSFRWTWYRNIAIDTDEGWVVIDPFNPIAARAEMAYLEKTAPGKKVRLLIYSHHHLDHTRGGAEFHPQEILANERSLTYFADLKRIGNSGIGDVVAPTKTVTGDQTLTIGGEEIRLVDLGKSHSDALYAFLLPKEKILFTADMGLVKAVPPLGIPDSYYPGVDAAMTKLAALDFDMFVPSHFDAGTKKDFLEYLECERFFRNMARESLAKNGQVKDKADVDKFFDYAYPRLYAKYGTWHGFNAMFISNVFRDYGGELLGY